MSLAGVGGTDSVTALGTSASDTFTVSTVGVQLAGRANLSLTGIETLTV